MVVGLGFFGSGGDDVAAVVTLVIVTFAVLYPRRCYFGLIQVFVVDWAYSTN